MQNIWLSLAWKEWQEHKWKIASIVAVVVGLVACMLAIGTDRSLPEALQVAWYVCGIPFAIFVGLGIAAGERSRGTLPFLQALPVPMWRIAVCKLAFALLSLFIALLATALLYVVARLVFTFFDAGIDVALPHQFTRGEEFAGHNWALVTACLLILIGTSLVTWTAAWGVNRRDEVSGGAVALCIMLAWWVVLFFIWMVLLRQSDGADTARMRAMGAGSAPVGFLFINDTAKNDATALLLGWLTFFVVHAALATRYVLKFGQVDDRGIRSPRSASRDHRLYEFLGQPRRFALTAIAWKQLRESGPIALAGLAAIVVITSAFSLAAWYFQDGLQNVPTILGQTATIFGFFVALVAGIGVSLHDVGTRLHTFWRSRPIQPDLWFLVKFITGLAVVMAVIYLPIGLFLILGGQFNEVLRPADVAIIPAAQVAVYTAAVLVTCVVRQAVYSAILSIAVVYLGVFICQLAWKTATYFGFAAEAATSLFNMTEQQAVVGLLVTSAACMIAAWLSMRNDWGLKSR